MNQQCRCKNSRETGNNSALRFSEIIAALTTLATTTLMTVMMKFLNNNAKTKALDNYCQKPDVYDDCDESGHHNHKRNVLQTSLIRRRHQQMWSTYPHLAIKSKTISLLVVVTLPLLLLLLTVRFAHAGFWTFYFPNVLKPSGYNELSDMIASIQSEINATKDAFADTQYFWGLMQQLDKHSEDVTSYYPEESVCSDAFPLFRDLAIKYAYIDYEHFIQPMLDYYKHLKNQQALWYPEGKQGKTILPREWEQKLYEKDLSLKMIYHTKLAQTVEYKQIREQLANIWRNVKRSLDSSIPCIYLRYAVRQVADDIDQQALDTNLERINEAMELVKSAYKRIENFSDSDEAAKKEIDAVLKKQERHDLRYFLQNDE